MPIESSESHLDLESQVHVLAKADNTSPSHRWRFIFIIFSVRQAFISSTTGKKRSLVTDVVSLSSTPSFRLNSSTAKSNTGDDDDDGDVQLTIRSSSTQVIARESVQPHGVDHESNKELQKANIAKIVKERDLKSLCEFGGAWGFAEALDTDLENGLPSNEDDLCCRRASTQPHESEIQAPTQGLFHILLCACNKYMICLLILCAILSMAFGIQEEGVDTGWYEGFFMVNAIIILVFVSVVREYWYKWNPSRRKELSRIEEIEVHVFRGGTKLQISMTNVLLGDVIILKKDDRIPADGLFVSGESLVLDEDSHSTIDDQNPFISYGSTVIKGNGRMLATSVGKDTVLGEMMSNVNVTNVPKKLETSLQFQVDRLNTRTQIIGLAMVVIILVIQFIRFKFDKTSDTAGLPDAKGKAAAIRDFVDVILRVVMKPRGNVGILVISVTVFLVGITEGLPLMVTLAIIYWNKKALSGRGTTRDFLACATTGSVTTICTDKNCGLTLNKMEVDVFRVGDEFIRDKSDVVQAVREPLCSGISTDSLRSQLTPCSLNLEEDPLLCWASLRFELDMGNLKQKCTIVAEKRLDSDKVPARGVLLRKGLNGEGMESHWKGPAPKILEMCSRYYNSNGTINNIDEQKRMALMQAIKDMQDRRLKTVAFGYKPNIPRLEEEDLILLGLVGLKHSCKGEIEACKGAGINIKLVSGCNVSELEAIAYHCGLNIPTQGSVVAAENFRNSTDEERLEMVDRICVMGNSLPSDKLLLVKCLKQKGHIVAMVGCRTDETPAIKEADVGIAVEECSTKMARESSNIILSHGDFNFLVTNVILCGRCAYENIQKFLQLELTRTISWLLTSITATACFGDAPVTAIQFLWICLTVPVLGGLALLTEPPPEQLTKKPPVGQPITRTMWRNIVAQALYQATALVVLQFKGQDVLSISTEVSKTMVFNSFVLCQVFSWFSARELEKKNVFKGIHRNCWFWMAVVAALVLQEVYTEIAHFVFRSPNLNGQQWAFCFLIGMFSWAIDWATKFISDFNTGSVGMTTSVSSESLLNLERPLINVSSQ